MSHGGNVQPALQGSFLLTTKDSLLVFEGARRGICPVVTRRLHDSEKATMIKSGCVFAFDENATGIKRWTDGTLWSPSRIIGNYLVYRELEKKGDRGQSQSARSAELQAGMTSALSSGTTTPFDPFEQLPTSAGQPDPTGVTGASVRSTGSGSTGLGREVERALIGSLTSSYMFKKDGLVKKTISNGSLHLVCYYSIQDVTLGRLRTPSSLIELMSLELSPALLNPKNFRLPPQTEYDSEGNLRYLGEETDPAAAASVLEPLVSPTFSHSQILGEDAGATGNHATGLPTPAYGDSEFNEPFVLDEETDSPYGSYQSQTASFHPPSPPMGQASRNLTGPSAMYGADFRTWPVEVQPYLMPPGPSQHSRFYSASPPTHEAELPIRPYTARAAPQARTIYRAYPYQRRVSDSNVAVGHAQQHIAAPLPFQSTSAPLLRPQSPAGSRGTYYPTSRLSYDRMPYQSYQNQTQAPKAFASSPTSSGHHFATQDYTQAGPSSFDGHIRWSSAAFETSHAYVQVPPAHLYSSGHTRGETYPQLLPQHLGQLQTQGLAAYTPSLSPQPLSQPGMQPGEHLQGYSRQGLEGVDWQ